MPEIVDQKVLQVFDKIVSYIKDGTLGQRLNNGYDWSENEKIDMIKKVIHAKNLYRHRELLDQRGQVRKDFDEFLGWASKLQIPLLSQAATLSSALNEINKLYQLYSSDFVEMAEPQTIGFNPPNYGTAQSTLGSRIQGFGRF